MADDKQQNEQGQAQEAQQDKDKQAATQAAEPTNTDTPSQAEQTVPYARFKEVNDRLKAKEAEDAKRAKEQETENEKRLAEQAQWQQLADQRKSKLDELTPKAELADRLSDLVAQQYSATIAEWPEQVKAMAPAEDASILDKLAWMEKAKPLAQELMADKAPQPGNGRRPAPVAAAGDSKAAETQRKRYEQRAIRQYR